MTVTYDNARGIIEISSDWERSEGDRPVQFYMINGERIGRKWRQVNRAIRDAVAIPTKLIIKACLLAKDDERTVRIQRSALAGGWIVR